MGEIVVDVELENVVDRGLYARGHGDEADIRRRTVKAVVDTGAAMLVLPQDVVSALGLATERTVGVTYANNETEIRPVAGGLTVRIGDRAMTTDCIVGPPMSEPLVGQIVLEALDLIADCATQTLNPRPESPDRPLLKVLSL